MSALVVLNPLSERSGVELASPVPDNPLPALSRKLRIGLLGNSKANVVELFEGIEAALATEFDSELVVVDKGNSAVPAPGPMLDDLARRCDLIITAMAD